MGDTIIGRRGISRRLVAGILLLSAFSALGAESATLDFDPDRVVTGERFTVQIRTSIPWGDEVEIIRPELNGPMVWWAYPYARPWTVQAEDGSTVRMIEVLAAIRVDKAGFFSIEPFRIRSGGREAVTDLKEIIGLEPDEADFPYPVTVNWRDVPETFWQGQAIPIVLEGRNFVSLTLADSVVLNSAPQGLLEDTHGFGDILTRPHKNDILYDVPMASWMWTVGDSGTFTFPGARLSVAGLNRKIPAFQVEALPLPEEVLSSGAVGHFSLSTQWDDTDYRVGDIVSVRIKVEGSGNLNVLKLPVPELSTASLVSQGSSSSFVPGADGYLGWRIERYDFQLERSGSLQLNVPDWTWLEPENGGRIRRQSTDVGFIQSGEAPGDDGKGDAGMLLGGDLFRYRQADFHWRNQYWFLLALPGFIALLTIFIIRRPGVRSMAVLAVLPLFFSSSNLDVQDARRAASAAETATEGDWDTAGSEYELLYDKLGEVPGLLNDMAVVQMEAGNPDKAVFYIRRALYLRPGSGRLAETLGALEERFGLTDQIAVPLMVPPALIFAIWLVFINLFFLSLTWLMFRRNAVDYIVFVSAMLLFATSTIFITYADRLWKHPTAVVKVVSEPLRKIPGPLATDWIQLPAGSAVSVTTVEGSDYLVRTGYGLEGWLPRSSLLFISEGNHGF